MLNLLVVANRTVPCPALAAAIIARTRSEPHHEVRFVAPALNSRLRHLCPDTDQAVTAAHARLEHALRYLHDAGVNADGVVGDSDPFLAIQDELFTFPAQQIIISTLPPDHSNWLERGLIERTRRAFGVPVHIVSRYGIPTSGAA
jgi:GABA permease